LQIAGVEEYSARINHHLPQVFDKYLYNNTPTIFRNKAGCSFLGTGGSTTYYGLIGGRLAFFDKKKERGNNTGMRVAFCLTK